MPFVREALKDRSTLEDWIKSYLNEELAKTDPLQFEIAFEENRDLSTSLDQKTLNGITKFVKENELDMREIHNNIKYHLPSFDAKWAMTWLKKDLPDFHERIVLHPRKTEFQLWLAKQITNIGEIIINTFKQY